MFRAKRLGQRTVSDSISAFEGNASSQFKRSVSFAVTISDEINARRYPSYVQSAHN